MRDTGFLDVVEGKRRWFVWEGDALEASRLVPDNAIGGLTLQAARAGQTSIFDAMAFECATCGYSPCLCDQA